MKFYMHEDTKWSPMKKLARLCEATKIFCYSFLFPHPLTMTNSTELTP
jgi:hypothetical protein